MEAKKALIEAFKESGEERIATRHLAAAYLLASTAYLHAESFEEMLRRHNLYMGGIKQGLNRVMKEFDKFFPILSGVIKEDLAKAYWADLDELTERVNKWVNTEG